MLDDFSKIPESPFFAISSFYKLPINHPLITSLSSIQIAWTLAYIRKEREKHSQEEVGKLRLLCTVTNPEIAKQIFMPEEKVVNINFKEQLENALGRELTDEEFENIENENNEYTEVSSIEDES